MRRATASDPLPPLDRQRELVSRKEIGFENAKSLSSIVVAFALGIAALTISLSIAANQDFESQSNQFQTLSQTFQAQTDELSMVTQQCGASTQSATQQMQASVDAVNAIFRRVKSSRTLTERDKLNLERQLSLSRSLAHESIPQACQRGEALGKEAASTYDLIKTPPEAPSDGATAIDVGFAMVLMSLLGAVVYLFSSAHDLRVERSKLVRMEVEQRVSGGVVSRSRHHRPRVRTRSHHRLKRS